MNLVHFQRHEVESEGKVKEKKGVEGRRIKGWKQFLVKPTNVGVTIVIFLVPLHFFLYPFLSLYPFVFLFL